MKIQVFSPLVEQIRKSLTNADDIAHQLHHWAYYKAFVAGKERIEDRAVNVAGLSKEIAKSAILLVYFIRALDDYADQHIRPELDQIYDFDILGSTTDYRAWVDQGYNPMRQTPPGNPRNARTYDKRLAVWKELFDNGIIDDKNNRITYEYVIQERQRYSKNGLIPYWAVWNYGSEDITGRQGYPNHSGIHYLEYAELELSKRLRQARTYFERYVIDSFINKKERKPRVLSDQEWREVYAKAYPDRL